MNIFSSIGENIWKFNQIEQNGRQFLYEGNDQINYEFKSLGNNRFVFILNDLFDLFAGS